MGRKRYSRVVGASVTGLSLALLALTPLSASATPVGATSDVDADGRTDMAVGIPEADSGTDTDAGALSVVPGGATGPDASGVRNITQETSGVPGGSEAGDAFGGATAYGDIDGDGYADLAVASPGEDLSGVADSGAVTLFYGSAAGLTPDATMYARPSSAMIPGDRCGEALTVGDFNADGSADVVAFCPGSWSLWWIDGATRTVRSAAPQSSGLAAESVTAVGSAAAASGDVDADGYDDAVLTFTQPDGTRPLFVLHGSADGVSTGDSVTLNGAGGVSLATGDLNGDGVSDVAVGRPDQVSGGAVTAYYGSADGLSTSHSTTVDQSTTAVPGSDESGDDLGASVGVGDVDDDGYAAVLAGLPGEDLSVDAVAHAVAGSVMLLHGSAAGITGSGSDTFYAGENGIAGAPEAGDRFGSEAALADCDGDGYADIGLGDDGEDSGNGAAVFINWSATGIDTASSRYFGPGTFDVTAGSHIGDVLAP
jgi:hypothetical protein